MSFDQSEATIAIRYPAGNASKLQPVIRRRLTMLMAGLAFAAASVHGIAQAQPYPDKSKPVKIIVPAGVASIADLLTRALGKAVTDESGLTVIVDNKPGAENVIGVQALMSSPPDGYTFLVNSNSSQSLNPVMIPDLKYDPLKDMQPVATLGKIGLAMNLGAATQAKTAREFIEAAKKEPGKYTCASATTTQRMACELFQSRAGVKLLIVPYKATAAAITALAAGEADVAFIDAQSAKPQWQTGRVRGVATTAPERSRALPNLPTMGEVGVPNFSMTAWFGVYAPEKTPPAVIAAMRGIVRKAATSKAFSETLTQFTMEPMDLPPDQITELIRREIQMWTNVVRDQNIKIGG